jgi:hypothetical protein
VGGEGSGVLSGLLSRALGFALGVGFQEFTEVMVGAFYVGFDPLLQVGEKRGDHALVPGLEISLEFKQLGGEGAVFETVGFQAWIVLLGHQRLLGGEVVRAVLDQPAENFFRDALAIGALQSVIKMLSCVKQLLVLLVDQSYVDTVGRLPEKDLAHRFFNGPGSNGPGLNRLIRRL